MIFYLKEEFLSFDHFDIWDENDRLVYSADREFFNFVSYRKRWQSIRRKNSRPLRLVIWASKQKRKRKLPRKRAKNRSRRLNSSKRRWVSK